MARPETISIPIDMPRDEACGFAELLKRSSYDDCLRRSNRNKRYSDGQEEAASCDPGCEWPRANSPRPASHRDNDSGRPSMPAFAIPLRAGEHHANPPVAAANRNGTQHRIDCWAGVVLAGTCSKPQPFAIHNQVPPRGAM
jgi:hypothetical protein